MIESQHITSVRFGEGKAVATRLLDLLAGWSSYVAADEENGVIDLALKSSEIHDLYQLAGELSLSWDHLSPMRQADVVRIQGEFGHGRLRRLHARQTVTGGPGEFGLAQARARWPFALGWRSLNDDRLWPPRAGW